MNLIDLHCHILPGIDDGPKSLDESLEMAWIFEQAGYSHVVATPHAVPGTTWMPKPEEIRGQLTELNQAIVKAKAFGFDLNGAVMASDAFFPFPDCVEIAKNAGISAVVQPGGSIKDQLSVDYCDANGVAMVMTGIRHFRH